MTSSLIASAMLRDPLYHIECLTAPSYTKYLISSYKPMRETTAHRPNEARSLCRVRTPRCVASQRNRRPRREPDALEIRSRLLRPASTPDPPRRGRPPPPPRRA